MDEANNAAVEGKKDVQPAQSASGPTDAKGAQARPWDNRDLTDGRDPGDWKTRYDADATSAIRREAGYLTFMFFLSIAGALVLWHGYPRQWITFTDQQYSRLVVYGVAFFGGMMGGALFAMNWLYHSVAKRIWHQDRVFWRLFNPLIGGGIGFGFALVVGSRLLGVIDQQVTSSPSMSMALGFLAGYFSDSANAKLAQATEGLFGKGGQR